MRGTTRFSVTSYYWGAGVSVAVSALCAILALITGLMGRIFFASPATLLLAGIGAMLVAIWVLLMGMFQYNVKAD